MSSEARSAAGGGESAGVARLAASQLKRMRRIVDSAVALAEQGGYDGVRLRDVAEESDVALGTLYKYFRSKEDILLFAVNEEAQKLEAALASKPVEGATPLERLTGFYQRATRGLTRKPNFAKAILRSIGAGDGDPETAMKVAGFHLRMSRMMLAALRDETYEPERPLTDPIGTPREREIAITLQLVWYASLVGWAGGLHNAKAIVDRVLGTAALLLGESP